MHCFTLKSFISSIEHVNNLFILKNTNIFQVETSVCSVKIVFWWICNQENILLKQLASYASFQLIITKLAHS